MVRLAFELLALLYAINVAYNAGREVGRAETTLPPPTPTPELPPCQDRDCPWRDDYPSHSHGESSHD